MDEPARQDALDAEHLRLLVLGFRISAGISAFFSLFGLLYVGLGVAMATFLPRLPQGHGAPPPAFVGWIMGAFGGVFFVLFLAMGALKLWTARCLDRRRSRTFCQVVAVLCCLGVPYGTILGVFTLIVLGRSSVANLFAVQGQDQL